MQFSVQVSQALKKAQAVILCLSDNFTPFQFPVPQFQAPLEHDPECNKGLIFAVALAPLQETEIKPVISIIDAFSGDERERRRRFIERITSTVAPAKKRSPKRTSASAGTTITQNINKARDVLTAGGNIIQTQKHITRPNFTPNESHITPEQASRIKKLVDELVEMDDASGKDLGRSYQRWWGLLKNTFLVTTYKEISRERFEEAVSLLQQAKARNLPAIRRKDNELWRRKNYAAIFAIAKKNLGWSEEDIHAFASLKLGETVSSLKDVGERDLTKIVRLIRAEARKR